MAASEEWRRWVPQPSGEPFRLVARFPERPGLWDLNARPEIVGHWVRILRGNLDYLRELLPAGDGAERRRAAERGLSIYARLLDDLERGQATRELRTIHEVTLVREQLLRSHGMIDPYAATKERESERLLSLVPPAIARAWAWGGEDPDSEPVATILADLLAGNLFDLGSASTQQAFRQGTLDYAAARERFRTAARAFLADLEAAALAQLCARVRPVREPAEGRLLLFADNAGADFLLGVLPAAAFWARRWEVCLVVNSLPVSSDISLAEARALLAALSAMAGSPLRAAMRSGRLRCVPSGTGSPGIDLRYVGAELNRAADGVGWILIVGQGRGIETNWETRFHWPVLRAAVVKDRCVAQAIDVAPGAPLLRWDDAAC